MLVFVVIQLQAKAWESHRGWHTALGLHLVKASTLLLASAADARSTPTDKSRNLVDSTPVACSYGVLAKLEHFAASTHSRNTILNAANPCKL